MLLEVNRTWTQLMIINCVQIWPNSISYKCLFYVRNMHKCFYTFLYYTAEGGTIAMRTVYNCGNFHANHRQKFVLENYNKETTPVLTVTISPCCRLPMARVRS